MWILLRFKKYKTVLAKKHNKNLIAQIYKNRCLLAGKDYTDNLRRCFNLRNLIFNRCNRRNYVLFAGVKASILVNTLWILLILSLLALALAWRISLELKLSSYFVSQLKDFYAAKGAVFYAMDVIRRDKNTNYDAFNEPWANDPTIFKEKKIKEEEDTNFTISYIYDYDADNKPIIYYGLVDEERKINLNMEDIGNLASLLNNLMIVMGEESILNSEIINSILDWRDSDFVARPENVVSESEFYGYNHPCRNQKFKVLEELMLLKGVDKDRFQEMRKYFTIYGDGRINVNTASREILEAVVLAALAPFSSYVDPEWARRRTGEVFDYLHSDMLNTRVHRGFSTTDDFLVWFIDKNSLPDPQLWDLLKTKAEEWIKLKSNFFQTNVEAQIKQTIKKKITVVFERTPNLPYPVWYWYED